MDDGWHEPQPDPGRFNFLQEANLYVTTSRMLETINIADENLPGETIILDEPGAQEYDVWHNLFNSFNSSASGTVRGARDVEVQAVLTAMCFNAIVFVILMASYEFFSRMLPRVYNANQWVTNSEGGLQHVSLPKSGLPLSWIPQVMRVSWSQVRKTSGLEAYMFLRYVRMCFQITAVSGLWAIVILWPVYATGGNGAEGWYFFSMSNLEQGSWKLWFPTFFLWMLTFYVMFVMNEEYKHYVECRMEFLAKGDSHVNPQQRFTLMVEEIPHQLRSDQAMHDYFAELFPGKVHASRMVLNVPDLSELCAHRERVLWRLEKCMAIQEVTGKKPAHIVGKSLIGLPRKCEPMNERDDVGRLPQRGDRVDSIQYFTRYLATLNDQVSKLQQSKLALARQGDQSMRASEWISNTLGFNSGSRSPNAMTGDGLILDVSPTPVQGQSVARKLGIDFLAGAFTSLHHHIDAVVDTVVGATMSSTGFVTFTDLVSLTCAVRAPLTHEASVLNVKMAPEPRAIHWENAHINQSWSAGREWTANVFLGLGAILWSIPLAAIQALANSESLAQIPGMTWLKDAQDGEFAGFINVYLPVLALLGIIALLPMVFKWIAVNYELRKTRTDVQLSILNRLFYFQLANVYITVTAGSILDSFADILSHPSYAFAILGKSVPTVVGYFVLFVLTKLFAGLPILLLQFSELSNTLFLKLSCQERILTQRELDKHYLPEPLYYGKEYPDLLLVIVIMFTYATICPIILPVGALYFLAALVVFKKQVLVVFSPTYESGGAMFPPACHRALIGLICGQFTLIGYTVLRHGFYQPMVLLPLPFYTISMMNMFKRQYADKGSHLSLERAVELDKQQGDVTNAFVDEVYRQPVLVATELEPGPYRREREEADIASLGSLHSVPMDGHNLEKFI